jgi:hypothetical protein
MKGKNYSKKLKLIKNNIKKRVYVTEIITFYYFYIN